MMMPSWLATALCALIAILLFVGVLFAVGWMMDRRGRSDSSAPFWLAVASAGVPVLLIQVLVPTVYVVDGDSDHGAYALLGDLTYSYEDGAEGRVPVSPGGYAVVNDTPKAVVVHEVSYSVAGPSAFGYGASPWTKIVEPMSHAIVPNEIEYFFAGDAPPSSLQSEDKAETRYWLTYPTGPAAPKRDSIDWPMPQ